MCAIAGIIGLSCPEKTKDKMLATMHRRGPDENGFYQNQEATLLHSRLAVIDIAGGRQPMAFSFGGETYIIVYNGELYNTDELRQTLCKMGHQFMGHSDTEVVLHAYAQWADACLQPLFSGTSAE